MNIFSVIAKSSRADLIFPVARIVRKVRQGHYAHHVRVDSGVFLAGVLQYLVGEIFDLAGALAAKYRKHRITPRHIMNSCRKDAELSELLKNVTFPQAGVLEHILPELLKRKKPKHSV